MADIKKGSITLPENYIVFDLETTGFTPATAEIIEIGALRMIGGKVDEGFHSYVKPRCFLPRHITELTGISSEMLDDAPRIEAVIPHFLRFLDKKPLTLVAHNASFDCRFMNAVCGCMGLDFCRYDIFDSLKAARAYVPTESHKLPDIKEFLGLDFPSHNAIDDCKVTAYLMEWCKRKASK